MTPPPPPDMMGAPGRRAPQPRVERPETPPRVRDKLVEGELLYARLAGQVSGMSDKLELIVEEQREGRREARAWRERADQRLDRADGRLDHIEASLAYRAGAEGAPPPVAPPTTQPNMPTLTPVTSASQARRAAAVGGGGLSLASLLGLLASLSTLPAAVQWALGAVAVVAGLGAVVGAVRWGWLATTPPPRG